MTIWATSGLLSIKSSLAYSKAPAVSDSKSPSLNWAMIPFATVLASPDKMTALSMWMLCPYAKTPILTVSGDMEAKLEINHNKTLVLTLSQMTKFRLFQTERVCR